MKTFAKIWLGIALIAIGIGTALLVIAIASGATFEDIPTFSYEESYTGVTGIDMDIEFGEVKLVEGDTFSIDATRIPENSLEAYVDDDGTWVIRQDAKNNNFMNIFGFNISIGNILRWDRNLTPRIIITVPQDFVADNISLLVKAGNVEAEELQAANGSFQVSAGRLAVNKLVITEESDYIIGAGQMSLRNVSLRDISVECGVGDVTIAGSVSGDSDIICNVGNVDLDLDGKEEDYSYDISASIGNINIDNNSYHSISNRIINNATAENNLSLKCEIGNISVDFY
jgi:hypothetical protein